jgi:RHS repeat-associated protein
VSVDPNTNHITGVFGLSYDANGNVNPGAYTYDAENRISSILQGGQTNRYYSNAYGRFMSPDPYQASGGPQDPGSWNRYMYTRGDPVNRRDPLGLADCTTCDDGPDDGYCPASIQSCAPLGSGGGGGDPNEAWYQQVARETTGLDSLVGQGLISNWDFVNGNISQIQFTLNGLMLFVPYYAVGPVAKPSGGYWAYVSCFLTGIAGAEINHPEVPGVSMWAILQGLITGAA